MSGCAARSSGASVAALLGAHSLACSAQCNLPSERVGISGRCKACTLCTALPPAVESAPTYVAHTNKSSGVESVRALRAGMLVHGAMQHSIGQGYSSRERWQSSVPAQI
eukprot:6183179-Pleurochrysis_carterae.AAC.2